MSSGSGLPRRSLCVRALAGALIGIGVAGCSAEPGRFEGNSVRGYPDGGRASGPGQRLVSLNSRPPLPIPESPTKLAADTAPRGGADDRAAREHAVAKGHGPAHSLAAGKIKTTKLAAIAPAGVKQTSNILHPAKFHVADHIAHPGPASPSPQRKNAPVVAEQPPAQPIENTPVVTPPPDAPTYVGALKPAESAPTFHWPVRGQLLAGFGSKINGQHNNGIDVAVPEDTSIKAADGGVVVYSGNQLRTFGNLLLVRHTNGYVTVYAHAKELLVKAGDEIKRGQIIAKAGRTGDADRPQLHFEIRKASTPVDPMPYLAGA
jgi:murein DD-endopeptidase MepM/ murein hydrolase activator NlpD